MPSRMATRMLPLRVGMPPLRLCVLLAAAQCAVGLKGPKPFFPTGASKAELRQAFKVHAAHLHPDSTGSADTVEEFKRLSAEYAAAMSRCDTDGDRQLLHNAWKSLGGLTAVAAAAYSAPAWTLGCAEAIGSLAALSYVVDFFDHRAHEFDEPHPLLTGGAGHHAADDESTIPELYIDLDWAIEREDYGEARAIKRQIDERIAVTHAPLEADELHGSVPSHATHERPGRRSARERRREARARAHSLHPR